MTAVQIHPASGRLAGDATVPYSKPHMQRVILLSLLTNAPSIIVHPAWSSETQRLFEAAQQFGLTLTHGDGDRLVVTGVGRSLALRSGALSTEGSAFNFRSLTALACLSPDETVIEAYPSMLKRPVLEHLSFVRDLGGELEDLSDDSALRIRVRGASALGGETTIDTRHSSQVLTSVLLIAPLAHRDVRLRCDGGALVGGGYVDLTVDMMRQQGAVVRQDESGFTVSPSVYQSRLHYLASDFTALSYLAGAVAVAPEAEISVVDYHPSTLTSEGEFFDALRDLGVHTIHDPLTQRLHIFKGPSATSVEIDARNLPTVVPTLAAIAPFVDATVTVRNATHVNNHKCRRLDVMINELRRMGCRIDPTFGAGGVVDGFTTRGRQCPAGDVALRSHGDHRIFMSLATAGLGAARAVRVEGVAHLHASFPNFLEVLGDLGAESSASPSYAVAQDGLR